MIVTKEDVCMLVVQFTLCFRTAFAFELLSIFFFIRFLPSNKFLPSKGLRLCFRRDFALPSKDLCHRIEGFLPSKCPCICHRRVFAFEVPMPSPSKGVCQRRDLAIEAPLPLKGLRHRTALAFAFRGPFPFDKYHFVT